ncbi:phage tail terminator family protein [Gorillibacterium sp. sgz5001074]|uniref:phage tail terminator family protein n=1 Tax=Gorillibacterium sp. sgz5001074 TaxID=3446695 RepID=UPI003F6741BF
MEVIKRAIMKRLAEVYPDMPVYVEQVEPSFTRPCWFVLEQSGSQAKELGNRYKRTALFEIQFFPALDSLVPRTQCNGVADQLYGALEVTEWEGRMYRGSGLRHEVMDGVLHFFITYQIPFLAEKPPGMKMQSLNQEVQHGT